jgi:D-3-phosphoglycerate dehydrogenase
MKEQKKILIGPSSFGELDKAPLEKLKGNGFEVVPNPFGRKLTGAELKDLLPGVTGIIAGLETLDREVMTGSTLRVISRCGVEMSNVDLEAARELGIIVKNTPDAPTASVAELAVGAMLGLLRMVPFMDRELHEGRWTKRIGAQLSGKTVAIIGFGRIGRYVARLLRPFGAGIIAVDNALEGEVEKTPIVSLDEALSRADIVTLHIGGTAQVLGKKEFAMMKEGVFVLNAARGGVIDEDALLEAINSGKVAGAWLDTFGEEPYRGPLTGCPQVILTPHVGSYSRECRRRMEMEAVDNLLNAWKEAGHNG